MFIDPIIKIIKILAAGNFQHISYSLWLRWHQLDFSYDNFISPKDGNYHAHSGGPLLEKVIREIKPPLGSVALDLGVGKGIAALTLSPFFESVIGVDLSPVLIQIAKNNLERMSVHNVELHCADARVFTAGLNRVTHVYMFNPFPAEVMSLALENLKRSLANVPRGLTIIYKFPVCHDTVVAAGFQHIRNIHIKQSHPFAIYEWLEN